MDDFAGEVLTTLDFLSNEGSSLDLGPDTGSESRGTTLPPGAPHSSTPTTLPTVVFSDI